MTPGEMWDDAMRAIRVEPDEGLAGLTLAGWVALLLHPHDLFGKGASFTTMAATGSELEWGVCGLLIFWTWSAGVLTRNRELHVTGLTALCAWWAFVAGMLYDAGGVGTGPIVYGLLSCACGARLFVRAGQG